MAKRTRVEHDSLGNVSVPSEALYGAQTFRAVGNFPVSGRTADPALIRAYLRLKAAAAQANVSCKTLSKKNGDLITRAVGKLLKTSETKWPSIFPVDAYQAGAGTSTHMNVNEVVANVANRLAGKRLGVYSPIHPNDHVNRSQSTNDTFPTAMRIALLDASAPLPGELAKISKAFKIKSSLWKNIPKSARTHLQDAVPMTLGQEFGGYAETLNKASHWVSEGRDALRELGLGGSAAGTGLTVPRGFARAAVGRLSRSTGERLRLAPSLTEAMQSQSPVTLYMSSLRLAAFELTRICNDLRLLASGPMTGLSEILLPEVQPGSSIMPGKVNPSIVEMANQSWYSILGYEQTVAYCAQAGQLELNVMMPMMAYASLEATRVFENALRLLRVFCIEGLKANVPRLKKYFESTPQIATALSPALGYEKTAKLVQESLASGKSVVELVREKKLLPEAQLRALIQPEKLTGVK